MLRPRREGDQLPPIPQPGRPDIQTLVIEDLSERRAFGYERYGTGVQPFNGRESLIDLYHELMDALVYTRQRIEEERITMLDDEVTFRSEMTVQLVQSVASDASVVAAARVSTQGDRSVMLDDDLPAGGRHDGLIRYLMKSRHGTPFEHTSMTFLVQAPIFVFRELMRHRIASYNEESGRYRELKPVFYVPAAGRNLVQVGKPGHYHFEAGTPDQAALVDANARIIARVAYQGYRQMLAEGVAREVARMVLPVSIYSSAYVTMNARALMNFLSLRTKREDAAFPSYPQREIELVAEAMEDHWKELMPLTHAAFEASGRVAP